MLALTCGDEDGVLRVLGDRGELLAEQVHPGSWLPDTQDGEPSRYAAAHHLVQFGRADAAHITEELDVLSIELDYACHQQTPPSARNRVSILIHSPQEMTTWPRSIRSVQ